MPQPRLVERKLGRERAYGLCWSGGPIEIDPRQRSQQRLDTIIHELLHHAMPDLSESRVVTIARTIRRTLWADRWRRVER